MSYLLICITAPGRSFSFLFFIFSLSFFLSCCQHNNLITWLIKPPTKCNDYCSKSKNKITAAVVGDHLFHIISHFAIQMILSQLFKIRLIVRQLLFTSVIKPCIENWKSLNRFTIHHILQSKGQIINFSQITIQAIPPFHINSNKTECFFVKSYPLLFFFWCWLIFSSLMQGSLNYWITSLRWNPKLHWWNYQEKKVEADRANTLEVSQ